MKRCWSLALLVLAEIGAACSYANGYDPARYANPPPAASVDPEIEPLPRSPRRQLRDPRGAIVVQPEPVDASASAIADVPPAMNAGAPADPTATCGTKADPCPMQRFMHGALATAHTPDTLTAAFTRLASMSPDQAWAWVAIATRGADLASAGDVAGAKAQCAACHEVYREPYRAQYRSRRL